MRIIKQKPALCFFSFKGYLRKKVERNEALEASDELVSCCQSVVVQLGPNISDDSTCDLCAQLLQRSKDVSSCQVLLNSGTLSWSMYAHPKSCTELPSSHKATHVLSLCCNSDGSIRDDSVSRSVLKMDYINLLADNLNRRCRHSTFAKKQGYRLPPFTYIYEHVPSIAGLQCQTNISLQFLTFDSFRYESFAKKLGVKLNSMKAGAVIVDKEVSIKLPERDLQNLSYCNDIHQQRIY